MKLKNEIYSIVRKEVAAQKICYHLSLNAQHIIFQAHFPEEPITPAHASYKLHANCWKTIYNIGLF